MQVAAGRALHYAAQLRSKGKSVTISLPSATTARDLQPTRQGETRPRTAVSWQSFGGCKKMDSYASVGKG